MSDFFTFLGIFVKCGTVFFVVMILLLALPPSKLRTIGMEMIKYAMAAGLVLLAASPLDILPEIALGPIGLVDDIGYVVAGIGAVRSGLGERQKRLLYEEIELASLRERAAKAGANHDEASN